MEEVFLELKGIKKSFGGVKALKGVNLTVKKGEVHCLAGENGCGKSTLIKVISGVHAADEGEIYIEGNLIKDFSPIDAIRLGIQVIYQDFAVFPNLTVAENIAMNKAVQTGKKFMSWKESREIALRAMEQIGAHMDPEILVERLSVANKQMVAICRAILEDAKLLILDEPTTALTAKEVDKLFTIIENLKNKGIAIIIVTHKIEEVYGIADQLTILRNGANVATGNIKDFDRPTFVKYMTGRNIEDSNYRPSEVGDEILRLEHLSREGAFQDVNFSLKKGDVLGITGLLGSGRCEIADALFGIMPADSGKIFLHGKEICIKNIGDAINHKFAYVPEDRLTQGLFLERSIADNTIAASIKKYFKGGRLWYGEMKKATETWIKDINIVALSSEPLIKTLSGGNQQKVVIAKWLNTHPDLLVLNGPTVGVDIGAKSDIHKILHQLAENGVGIIIISDDLSELVQNCNKIIVMSGGAVGVQINSSQTTESELAEMLNGKTKLEGA
ncbi:sugar ABC transporter ATP-binding protein [Clostridium magnum]|uniref:Galactose/methyl galactoside import ATP-binding protein MglA n=1 Tax=Clostridium magnum DSM 2767 TaxID=1121326 RepID=A0A161XDF8_9CLOT|nr:sugar ABC transporter ATP-binding protein [Clostridium magnum]KZL92386.1 galactose/methyl galactoside import ATP-binding protein MglA [Clostridium magnum DSM 2767]SHH11208.1 monosaccharide ABC transporter ATP-binding protein, CUT2 family (TC 3.A.1.2.-) [Clostridium magnum DSM 2767]